MPHRKKGEFFAKIQVSQRKDLTKSEKKFGGHYLLQQKHFPCITSTQETNAMLGLRSSNLKKAGVLFRWKATKLGYITCHIANIRSVMFLLVNWLFG